MSNPFIKYEGIDNPEQESNIPRYAMNDMNSVYTHYDPKTGRNIPTENKLKGGKTSNGTSSK